MTIEDSDSDLIVIKAERNHTKKPIQVVHEINPKSIEIRKDTNTSKKSIIGGKQNTEPGVVVEGEAEMLKTFKTMFSNAKVNDNRLGEGCKSRKIEINYLLGKQEFVKSHNEETNVSTILMNNQNRAAVQKNENNQLGHKEEAYNDIIGCLNNGNKIDISDAKNDTANVTKSLFETNRSNNLLYKKENNNTLFSLSNKKLFDNDALNSKMLNKNLQKDFKSEGICEAINHFENKTFLEMHESNKKGINNTKNELNNKSDELKIYININNNLKEFTIKPGETFVNLYNILFGTENNETKNSKLYYKKMLVSKYSTLKTINYDFDCSLEENNNFFTVKGQTIIRIAPSKQFKVNLSHTKNIFIDLDDKLSFDDLIRNIEEMTKNKVRMILMNGKVLRNSLVKDVLDDKDVIDCVFKN